MFDNAPNAKCVVNGSSSTCVTYAVFHRNAMCVRVCSATEKRRSVTNVQYGRMACKGTATINLTAKRCTVSVTVKATSNVPGSVRPAKTTDSIVTAEGKWWYSVIQACSYGRYVAAKTATQLIYAVRSTRARGIRHASVRYGRFKTPQEGVVNQRNGVHPCIVNAAVQRNPVR